MAMIRGSSTESLSKFLGHAPGQPDVATEAASKRSQLLIQVSQPKRLKSAGWQPVLGSRDSQPRCPALDAGTRVLSCSDGSQINLVDGTNGTNGATGANGASAVVTTEKPGANCANGGVKVQVGSSSPTYVY